MKPKKYKGPSPIEAIKEKIQLKKLRNVDVSRMLDLSPSSITVMLTRQDMSVYKLIDCCYGFRYNFLQELANHVELPGPPLSDMPVVSYPTLINMLKEKNGKLENKISDLENKSIALQTTLDEANQKLLMLGIEHKTVKEILNKLLEAKQS